MTVALPWKEKFHAGAGEAIVLLPLIGQPASQRRTAVESTSTSTSPPARFGSRAIPSPDRVRVRMRLRGIGAVRMGEAAAQDGRGGGCGQMEGHGERT